MRAGQVATFPPAMPTYGFDGRSIGSSRLSSSFVLVALQGGGGPGHQRRNSMRPSLSKWKVGRQSRSRHCWWEGSHLACYHKDPPQKLQ